MCGWKYYRSFAVAGPVRYNADLHLVIPSFSHKQTPVEHTAINENCLSPFSEVLKNCFIE